MREPRFYICYFCKRLNHQLCLCDKGFKSSAEVPGIRLTSGDQYPCSALACNGDRRTTDGSQPNRSKGLMFTGIAQLRLVAAWQQESGQEYKLNLQVKRTLKVGVLRVKHLDHHFITAMLADLTACSLIRH